jgi:hypothetical protein
MSSGGISLEALLISTLCGSLSLLIVILGWIGLRVHAKLDDLTEKMDSGLKDMNKTLSGIEKDLRGELSELDRRITRMEDTIPPYKVKHHDI